MKLFAAILFSVLVLQVAQAKNASKNLPSKIVTYMKENYPNATKVEWIKANNQDYKNTVYQADFYDNGLLVILEITPEGEVLAKETELLTKDIPKDMLFYIQGHKLKYVARIDYNDEKSVYVMETMFKKHEDFMVMNPTGTSVLHVKKHFLLF